LIPDEVTEFFFSEFSFFYSVVPWGGVRLSPLGISANNWIMHHLRMRAEYGEFGGIKIPSKHLKKTCPVQYKFQMILPRFEPGPLLWEADV
jgi:hypothetical protein